MGEVDTKPIESVQAALSLFGEKNDQRKYRSAGSEGSEKEDWELMLTGLAKYKVQLEVKENAYKQALLKIESYHITIGELHGHLKNCEAERTQSIQDCREARAWIDKLEFRVNEISDLLLDAGNAQEQLIHVVSELNATREELHNVKAELAASEESKVSAMTRVELIETAVELEKERNEELLRDVSELKEAAFLLKLAAIEAEKENSTVLSQEDEIRMNATEAVEAQEQLEEIRKQCEMMRELENQLLSKTLIIDSLQLELKQAKVLHSSSEKAASNVVNDLNQLKSELELVQREKSDQASHIESTDTELGQLQSEVKTAKAEVEHLNHEIDMLTGEIQKTKNEMDELSRRECEGQVEIALLQAEIHKGRSKVAAAEAAEARAKSFKSGLYLAVKQLAIEADEAKKEIKMLKLEMDNSEAEEETGSFTFVSQTEKAETGNFTFVDLHVSEYTQDLEVAEIEESTTLVEAKKDDFNMQITISMEEYESLVQKAQMVDQVEVSAPEVASHLVESQTESELHALKKDLEAATMEIEELRSVAKEAVNRADQAERAKAAIEDQLRKWREHKQQRRDASLAALRKDLIPKEGNHPKRNSAIYNRMPTPSYQPLGKVLDMDF